MNQIIKTPLKRNIFLGKTDSYFVDLVATFDFDFNSNYSFSYLFGHQWCSFFLAKNKLRNNLKEVRTKISIGENKGLFTLFLFYIRLFFLILFVFTTSFTIDFVIANNSLADDLANDFDNDFKIKYFI